MDIILALFGAFLVGVLTKLGDLAYDNGLNIPYTLKILLGVVWGALAGCIMFINIDVAAFYVGIILSWIIRYKIDNYSHGIATVIMLTIFYLLPPLTANQTILASVTFLLFTLFGYVSRHKLARLGCFQEFNIYSFIFLGLYGFWYSPAWIVAMISVANVIGYHLVKRCWRQVFWVQ